MSNVIVGGTQASDVLFEQIFPQEDMPPRSERISVVEDSIRCLGGVVANFVEYYSQDNTRVATLRAASTYCTVPAYRDLVRNDKVGQATAQEVSHHLNNLGEFLLMRGDPQKAERPKKGVLAEMAVLQTLWNAITDCSIDEGYALLSKVKTGTRKRQGLPDDVDLLARVEGKRQKVQVKYAKSKEGYTYKRDIKVVSAQGLVPENHQSSPLHYLFRLHRKSDDARLEVYKRLSHRLLFK